jgi:hypothetical protein
VGRGGQLIVALPPPAASLERRRPRSDQPGRVIPGKTPQKKQTMIYYLTLKIYPKKLSQAADEIFRVAACPL